MVSDLEAWGLGMTEFGRNLGQLRLEGVEAIAVRQGQIANAEMQFKSKIM